MYNFKIQTAFTQQIMYCRYIFNGDFLMIFDIRYLAKHQWLA